MNAIIVIGSNYGDRDTHILNAMEGLSRICTIKYKSDVYESPDYLEIGKKYLNQVVVVCTDVSETDLNLQIKKIEAESGRTAQSRKRGEVPLDIDIVIWNGEIRRPEDYASTYFTKGYKEIQGLLTNFIQS